MAIELIHRHHCPYSARVRDFIDEKGLKDRIAYAELSEDPGAEARLAELTGRSQVPCLVVDGKPMLESESIIRWLDENLVRG